MEDLARTRKWVLIACVLLCCGGQGILLQSVSIFVKPVCDDLLFSRAQFTAYNSIQLVISTLLLPVIGSLFSKPWFNKIILLSAIVSSCVPFAFAVSTELWHFYGLAAILGLVSNGVGVPLTALIINHWYDEKKGLALGVTFGGSGVSAALMVQLGNRIIDTCSWRWAYITMGILCIITLITAALILQRFSLCPSLKAESVKEEKEKEKAHSLLYVIFSSQFLLLALASFLIGFASNGLMTHSVAYASDVGFSVSIQSAIGSLTMIFTICTKVLLGRVLDRWGTKTTILISTLSVVAGSFLFIYLADIPFAYIFVCVAIALAMSSNAAQSVMTSDIYGPKIYSQIYTITMAITVFGLATGGIVPGWIFDMAGTYMPVWYTMIFVGCLASVCYLAVLSIAKKKLIKKVAEE